MKFYVPAICWMQGESDMYDYTNVDYKQRLNQFSFDINKDIKVITHQKQDIKIVSYQAHPTFRVMRQSCSAYSLSLKYLSSLKPYALRFITFILLFIPSTLAVEI